MTKNEKRVIIPIVIVNHNDADTGLEIRVDLAGASKESVDLDALIMAIMQPGLWNSALTRLPPLSQSLG